MAERNLSVQPDCRSDDTSLLQLSYSIPEEALLCPWGVKDDAGQMVLLAREGSAQQPGSDPCWLLYAFMLELTGEHFSSTERKKYNQTAPLSTEK